MFRRRSILLGGLLGVIMLLGGLSACASAGLSGAAPEVEEEAAFYAEEPMEMEAPGFADEEAARAAEGFDSSATANQQGEPQERLIIRTGDLSIIVDDSLETLDSISQMTSAMGGFVVSSNTYQSGFESAYHANVTIRVPAERFDEAMESIKSMAVEVSNETVSGQDVTAEFVDLDARVNNLKAAEEQLQEIMDNAQDTEDVLSVYNELIRIRGEIESLEGRMKYLSESARLSTINVGLSPNIITQPVEVRWKPLETVKGALETLGRTMAGVVDFLIRFVIVGIPTLLVIGLVLGLAFSPFYFVGRALIRRRRRRKQQQQSEES
jgi:hypothetical protein